MAPWGWECKARLVKQNVLKPTEKRPTPGDGFVTPGPANYQPPDVYCGPGFSHIKQAPAYSFGMRVPVPSSKPAVKPNAPVVNISGLARKGRHKIPQGVIAQQYDIPGDKTQKPGPGAYSPKDLAHIKRPPAYSMRIAAKPPYEPWDMWTPSPNMYHPPILNKKPPAYSFGNKWKPSSKEAGLPGPAEHYPKVDCLKRSNPAYSLGHPFRPLPYTKTPAPNTYCEKRYMYSKRSAPAPSFGIHHSPYLGGFTAYEMPSQLEQLARDLK